MKRGQRQAWLAVIEAAAELLDNEDPSNPRAIAIYVDLRAWHKLDGAVAAYQAEATVREVAG